MKATGRFPTQALSLVETVVCIFDTTLDNRELRRAFEKLELRDHLVILGGYGSNSEALKILREVGPPIDVMPPKDEIAHLERGTCEVNDVWSDHLRGYLRVTSMISPGSPIVILVHNAALKLANVLMDATFEVPGLMRIDLRMNTKGRFTH